MVEAVVGRVEMPEWASIFLGAFLGAVFGYYTNWWHDWRKARQARRALGSIFYGELITESPGSVPIIHSPPLPRYAPLVRLNALSQLLAPGVIDPQKEDDLLMQLIHLAGAVQSFNDAARMFNDACLQGVSQERRQEYANLVQGTYWDYEKAHKWTMAMINRIGPRPPILNDQKVRLP